ncbi:MAG: U32 family peptidase [Erysipelotrichaceae bacterium]|nr:U32 family peptidase [Erysipelotrichaceae bacterium]MBR5048890.1 U32 family peptidase [Erysipelotrichaceae bacterium]
MRTELLAPAGDLERAKTAIVYGADAVYFGGRQFSLRARASNFSLEDIREAAEFAHQHGSRVYVTVNMIPHNSDFEGLEDYLKKLEEYGVDAIICASRAIMAMCRSAAPKLEVHISTQQTSTNSQAVSYWQQRGADRVVLGREVDYENLKTIMSRAEVPIEVFIHGGMCANYSGRCTISNLLTNRDANRGGCAQSCRWNYHLYHGDQLLDREEYLLSLGSRDMAAPDYLERLLRLNVASLKIEGRMKTAYYLANVIKAYRFLIDRYYNKGEISEQDLAYGRSLLARVANRPTYDGFYGGLDPESQIYNLPSQVSQNYVASVADYRNGMGLLETRNFYQKGDRLALMNPQGEDISFLVERMMDEDGNEVTVANKPMQRLWVKLPAEADRYSFIKMSED